ncbi:VOC family protein [Catellatospora sichuanensis]|uniref:VOC family protein n=1 Tax=Catellatospora sichuanensis TaxID=1969805 RepID=UPI0011843EBE|nr:VOC family protein [Catellatospora sichuanensis]
MTSQLFALCFDAIEPLGLARFWAGVLGRQLVDDPRDGVLLLPGDDLGIRIRFVPTQHEKTERNLIHFDLTSGSLEEQQATVARALELGGRRIDVGQGPDADHVVMADPEGNEFCVIEPGNRFLDGCGFIGALSCDGTPEVGYFWSAALGWPLVWDQDQETAIQSPQGGPKITWGGPPYMSRPAKDRLYFDLTAVGEVQAEVDRLLSLGAKRADTGEAGWTALTDPDGNAFRVSNR